MPEGASLQLENKPTLVWGDPVSPQQPPVLSCRRSQVIEKFEALDIEKAEHMETNLPAGHSPSSDMRQGRSEKRAFPRKRVSSGWDTGPPSLSPTHTLTRFCWAPHSPFTVVCLGLSSPPISDLLKEEPASLLFLSELVHHCWRLLYGHEVPGGTKSLSSSLRQPGHEAGHLLSLFQVAATALLSPFHRVDCS